MVALSHRKRRTDVFLRSCCSSERCSHVSSCFCKQAHGAVNLHPDSSSWWKLRHWNSFPYADTEDMDNERKEMMEADVAGLHQFFSKHLEIPGHKDLLTLFSQVPHTHIHNLISLMLHFFWCVSGRNDKSDICYLFYSIGCMQRFHYRGRWALPPGHCSLPRVRWKNWYGVIWNGSKDGDPASTEAALKSSFVCLPSELLISLFSAPQLGTRSWVMAAFFTSVLVRSHLTICVCPQRGSDKPQLSSQRHHHL